MARAADTSRRHTATRGDAPMKTDQRSNAVIVVAKSWNEKGVDFTSREFCESCAMSISIVRLGSPRKADEGLRVGTVRMPPRGVPKSEFSSGNWYDVWFPNLAPSKEIMKIAHTAKSEKDWDKFKRRYRSEMATPGTQHDIALLAALSREINLSVGCYCDDKNHCHRSVLKQLFKQADAKLS
jgi:uncharacterized protein YeaO (DUF488 family)